MSRPDDLHGDRSGLLASIATLGLGRAALPQEGLWPHASLAHDAPPGTALLRAAAANAVWQLAGQRVRPSDPPVRDAPATASARLVSEAAALRLGHMLSGTRSGLVTEWFVCASEAGLVLPPHWLPVVLGALEPTVRQTFTSVLGPLGAWLASKNPAWADAAPLHAGDDAWAHGTFEQRKVALALQRQRDPSEGRRWVESTWLQDAPEERAAFIQGLRTGLGRDDEALLERALDDSRKSVRAAAVECLMCLPESAHARRSLERLRQLLQLRIAGRLGALTTHRLDVQLPDAPDRAAIRDGIELKVPAGRKVGERVWWLMQMVAMTPPGGWMQQDCDADAILDAALATDYSEALLQAFTTATLRRPDAVWISALCRRWTGRRDQAALVPQLAALLSAAPDDARDGILQDVVRLLGAAGFDTTLALLSRTDGAWSAGTTELALMALGERGRSDRQQWQHPRTALVPWAPRVHIETAARDLPVLTGALPAESPWRSAIEELADSVEFRSEMRRELAP